MNADTLIGICLLLCCVALVFAALALFVVAIGVIRG